ncbi:hypothetical protein [Streptomyces sp. NPDC019937]|uniref:hypothetical protein n=1 Tax=Streptomyces sp. NPDC019937 TaxID=3154787 RepID=UPI0033E6AD3E
MGMGEVGVVLGETGGFGDPWEGVDAGAVARAAREQGERAVAGVGDMAAYLDAQVADASHREVIGPLLDGGGASGVVVRRGVVIGSWGGSGAGGDGVQRDEERAGAGGGHRP